LEENTVKDLTIIKQNGSAYIDSREVAEIIGKRHHHLLRDINSYIHIMQESTETKNGFSDFFLESSYTDATGRNLPCYLLSKMGCAMVANKLTGEKGVLFTAAYVRKFDMMEKAEQMRAEENRSLPIPRLGEINACVRIIVPALRKMGVTSEQIVEFLTGVYEPFGITVAACDDFDGTPRMYTAKQIAKILGVYSHSGNPHNQAVASILNENIFISDIHKSVTTEGYGSQIGVRVRYDDCALQSVKDWLIEYGYPCEIYGFERTYRVCYK
jgi:Rha family phage regulatory protein